MSKSIKEISREAAGKHYDSFGVTPSWRRDSWIDRLAPIISDAIQAALKERDTEDTELIREINVISWDDEKNDSLSRLRRIARLSDRLLAARAKEGQ